MIADPTTLADVIEAARAQPVVALDTEFIWERTYFPALGLVQLGWSEEDVHLIDTVALEGELGPLGELLADAAVVKVLHDATQDLTILRRATGSAPKNVFDTRTSAGFVGSRATLSLGNVVQEMLGVHLPKTESRTDWLRRPLSAKQLDYALDDVRYLPAAREEILRRAEEMGRAGWIEEEMALLDDPARYGEVDPQRSYARLKGLNRLSRAQLTAARELAAWREEEARARDQPRGFIVPDDVLVALARRQPETERDVRETRGMSPKAAQRYTDAILDALDAADEVPEDERPSLPRRGNRDETLTARLDLALAFLKGRSLEAGIDPALIASRGDLNALLQDDDAGPEDHAVLRGWRGEFFGADLLGLLRGERALRVAPKTGLPQAFVPKS